MVNLNFTNIWQLSPAQARNIQQQLAQLVITKGQADNYRFIAAADISIKKNSDLARAAIVVVSYPHLDIVDTVITVDSIYFPYIPGLLSFRETPLLLTSFKKLTVKPDLLLVDGQGIAHPRRFGLASHLGLILDIPSIGCAKSRLCGIYGNLNNERGDYVNLMDGDEIIGAVVRTKENIKPIYVSIGHKIDLPSAIKWTMLCCTKYRIPEPLRLAHLYANDILTTSTSSHELPENKE